MTATPEPCGFQCATETAVNLSSAVHTPVPLIIGYLLIDSNSTQVLHKTIGNFCPNKFI